MKARLHFALFVTLVLPLAGGAHAAGVHISAVQTLNSRTTISGTWPNACTPVVQVRTATASRTDVLLGSGHDLCAPNPHAFSVTLEPQPPFSPAPLPDRVRPLQIFSAVAPSAPSQLVAFRLLGGRATQSHPDAGFWWPESDTTSSGTVLSMELQGNALGLALMTFDDATGTPVWYFGTTQLHGSVAHVDLVRMDGGSSPFANRQVAPQAHHSLAMDLAFASDTRARAYLSHANAQGGIDVVAMTISRVPFTSLPQQQAWLGTWLVAGAAPASTQSATTQPALPTSFNWASSSALDASHIRLIDASGNYALDCQYDTEEENAPAQYCRLRDADGNVIVVFDHVGFDRLDGHMQDGSPVILVRPR